LGRRWRGWQCEAQREELWPRLDDDTLEKITYAGIAPQGSMGADSPTGLSKGDLKRADVAVGLAPR
jgi:hypothetical protein